MLKVALLLFLLFSANQIDYPTNKNVKTENHKFQNRVYICKGPDSYRYHSRSNCRGLNNCTTEVYPVSIAHAKRINRTACKICL